MSRTADNDCVQKRAKKSVEEKEKEKERESTSARLSRMFTVSLQSS